MECVHHIGRSVEVGRQLPPLVGFPAEAGGGFCDKKLEAFSTTTKVQQNTPKKTKTQQKIEEIWQCFFLRFWIPPKIRIFPPHIVRFVYPFIGRFIYLFIIYSLIRFILPWKKTASLHLQIDDFWEQVRLLFVLGALYQSRLMYNAPFFLAPYVQKLFGCWSQGVPVSNLLLYHLFLKKWSYP